MARKKREKKKGKEKMHLIWNDFDNGDAGVVFVTFMNAISKVGEVARNAASGRNDECGVKGREGRSWW